LRVFDLGQIYNINQKYTKEIAELNHLHAEAQKQSQWRYAALSAEKKALDELVFELEGEIVSLKRTLLSLDNAWNEKCKIMIANTNLRRDQSQMADNDLAYFRKCEHYDALVKDLKQLKRTSNHQEHVIGSLRDSLTGNLF